MVGKTTGLEGLLDHRVQRVADNNENGFGAGGFDLLGDGGDDFGIGGQ